ncbi:putative transposase OrfB [Variovorax sp. SRS16]|nr:putative transposase OrfB [Variovorax sp. SRS16]
MRVNAIRGVSRRRGFIVTTRRDQRQPPAPDLVKREFIACGPNELWVADMTYVPTWAGFIFLAIVLDVWSRRVVGWVIGEQMTADLVLAALNMALQPRKPDGVIHHSDQGSQYTSIAFGERRKKMGVRPSMGTVGDVYDNAMAESFFATLECELIDRRSCRRHIRTERHTSRVAQSQFGAGQHPRGAGRNKPRAVRCFCGSERAVTRPCRLYRWPPLRGGPSPATASELFRPSISAAPIRAPRGSGARVSVTVVDSQ